MPTRGEEGIARLAAITGRAAEPLNHKFGIEGPLTVARIDEDWCIGCTLCIKACPTDAILGANKRMHSVIPQHCTGCELCIPVCPVDCISLDVVSGEQTGWDAWSAEQAEHARQRYHAHQQRLARSKQTVAPNAQAAAPSLKWCRTRKPPLPLHWPRRASYARAAKRTSGSAIWL